MISNMVVLPSPPSVLLPNYFCAKVYALLQDCFAPSQQNSHFGLLSLVCPAPFLRPPEFHVLLEEVLASQFLDDQFVLFEISHLGLLAQAAF